MELSDLNGDLFRCHLQPPKKKASSEGGKKWSQTFTAWAIALPGAVTIPVITTLAFLMKEIHQVGGGGGEAKLKFWKTFISIYENNMQDLKL